MELTSEGRHVVAAEDSRRMWAKETRAAIEFEEDPHRAALEDNPPDVYIGGKTWAACFALALTLGAPIGLAFVSLASVVLQVTTELDGTDKLPWVVGAWSIASASSAAVAGSLSDTFGRRNVILIGDLIVLLGCILGGTARSIEILISAQTLIGVGTGFVFVAFASVPEMLPNKWKALGSGIVESGINVPWSTIGGVMANALTRYASWRWIFYIAILTSFLTFKATAMFYWPVTRPQGDFGRSRWRQVKEIDYIGLVTVTGGLVVFLCGLTWGGVTYPWNHPGTIVPVVLGLTTLMAGFVYDWTIAKNPMFPFNLFRPRMFKRYVSLLVVLFVSGSNFYAMTALLPQGSLLMFTADGMEIGIMSLPNTIMQLIVGLLFPLCAHKMPQWIHPRLTIKWQLVLGMTLQCSFLALSALSVDPNNYYAYIFLPAFGVPMFTWVTILSHAIASLHVPHSQLGVALGLLSTFRSTGGAVGNAFFQGIFDTTSRRLLAERLDEACQQLGLSLSGVEFDALLADTVAYNQGIPNMLKSYGPEVRGVLQAALRSAYGATFRTLFFATIPFSFVALVCSLFIEDPTPYMTNHIQSKMYERGLFGSRNLVTPDLMGDTGRRRQGKRNGEGRDEADYELRDTGSRGSQVPLTITYH